jgi:hypothetical protein
MIWFSLDANIQPLDEIVALARPRVEMMPEQWMATPIFSVLSGPSDIYGFQQKALRDHNDLIDIIACSETKNSVVNFDENFSYDLGGC